MRYLLLIILFTITIARLFYLNRKKEKINFLFLSLFIQQIPLGCLLYSININPLRDGMPGAFENMLSLDVSIAIIVLALLFQINKTHYKTKYHNKLVAISILAIFIISILNPYNKLKIAEIPILFRIIQIYLFFYFISKYLSREEVLHALFDGFKYAIIVQFIITLFFPVFSIKIISQIFHPEISEWAFRRGTPSAIGTFIHPGALALFAAISTMFFFSCYLNKYKVIDSLKMIFIGCFIIYFTFSRTSYLAILGSIFIIYLLYKNSQNLNRPKLILQLLGAVIIIEILYLSPISDLFFRSDLDTQIDNRLLHYNLAFKCFSTSPLIGIGINTHVKFMQNLFLSNIGPVGDFFLTNPIHNSHLIILAETGIIGFSFWSYYIISRIYSNTIKNKSKGINSIINWAFAGVLITYTIYGVTGWSCFHREIYPIIILFGFFYTRNK